MKKFLLALFSFLLLLSSATPALAQTDLTCSAADLIDNATGAQIMTAESCQAIKDLFNNSRVDGPWYDQNPNQFAKKVFRKDNADEIFGERYTYAQINWIINSIAAMLNPASGISNPKQLFDFFIAIKKAIVQTQSGQPLAFSDYAKLGPMGLFAGGISALYTNPPASGIQEIKYTASKIFDYTTGTEPVYAQSKGYGFTGLGGDSGGAVRALWTASRNMAYLIMTILLIASGFLIMFRVKINPQTVVSLQTMIPKLIITMILVTFSFAIAGLVIDLIYVFIATFVGLLSLNSNLLSLDKVSDTIKFLTAAGFSRYFWYQFIIPMLIGIATTAITGLIGSAIPIVGTGAGIIVGLFLGIIFSLWALIILWKIFWMLIKTYVTLVLLICIGPLQIMLDLIPGQQGFGPWVRNIIANASVFAVVPIMLTIQNILSGNAIASLFGLNLGTSGTFANLGGSPFGLPFLPGGSNFIISLFGGYVILSMTPKIADMIRDALKIPAFKYGAALGEPFGYLPIKTVQETGRQTGIRYGAGVAKGVAEAVIPSKYDKFKGTVTGTLGEIQEGRLKI